MGNVTLSFKSPTIEFSTLDTGPIVTTAANEAGELSTYMVSFNFRDEDGNAVTPISIRYNLTDKDGQFINSRENIPIATDSDIVLILSGNDLSFLMDEGKSAERILTIEANIRLSGRTIYPHVAIYKFNLIRMS